MNLVRSISITGFAAIVFLALSSVGFCDVIWDEDSQSYINVVGEENPKLLDPGPTDQVELLWDDIHDNDGDDLFVNYSDLYNLMVSIGYNPTQVQTGTLNSTLLAGYDVLVLIDEEVAYSAAEIADVQTWIAGGGKLLMIGEHFGAFNPTSNNAMIAPYNMQFIDVAASGATNFATHPITTGLSAISWAAGASLSYSAPAVGLAWDASSNYGITVNESGVTVVILDDSNMMDNLRLANDDNTQCMTNVFNYLAGGAPPPDFTVTLTYNYGSPVPPGGGAVNFDVFLQNNETTPQNFDLWIEIPPQIVPPTVPNRNLTFPGGYSITRPDMNWPIPGSWPAGNYTMIWNIGVLASGEVWATDSFRFSKSADDDGSGFAFWEIEGDPLDQLFEGLNLGEAVESEVIWDDDSQSYINVVGEENPKLLEPGPSDQVDLLWDDIHDSDGDDLFGNYSDLYNLMVSLGYNPTQVQTGTLNSTLLAGYDVLVLIDEEVAYSAAEIADVQTWITGGGKLLMIGENYAAFNPVSNNAMIAPYNMQFYSASSSGATGFATHPITTGLTTLSWLAGSAQNYSTPAQAIGWDASNQDVITVNESGVVVVVLNDSGMMNNSSIFNDDNYQCMTNVFNYLAGGAPPPSFTVTLTYNYGSPVPPGGGAVNFDVFLQNNETVPVNFDLWIEIPPQITPPGVPNRNLTFPPGFSITRPDMNWPIPGGWPAGNYTMDWYIGNLATTTAWASDSFPFVKSADDDGSGYVLWEVDYDPLDQLFEGIYFGEMVVSEFALLGSYPNPFNPSTTISYTLDNANSVKLAVYDLSGREVATLVNGYREIGTHVVTFDASGLASGVYIYRLTSGMNVASGKMVLTK